MQTVPEIIPPDGETEKQIKLFGLLIALYAEVASAAEIVREIEKGPI